MIAGPWSHCGKTSVTLSFLYTLAQAGYKVQPYKTGPDYLDGTYHRIACGTDSYNLDSWMSSSDFMKKHFLLSSRDCDIAIIEGAMGLFDGYEGSHSGSCYEIAKILDVPVLLVIDCKGFSGSIAPIIFGYLSYKTDVNIIGVILNKVGSKNHLQYLREALNGLSVKVFGHIFRNESIGLEHRHLGLVNADQSMTRDKIRKISEIVRRNIDLDSLFTFQKKKSKIHNEKSNDRFSNINKQKKARIAIAYDEAFHFYYKYNLELLEQAGADTIKFSPIHDRVLPENIQGIYLGGGYPEIFAEQLESNHDMIRNIQDFAECSGFIYAECGGLIYLGKTLEKQDKQFHFCRIFSLEFKMLPRKKALGYVEIELIQDTILGNKEQVARGHEFHYSEIKNTSTETDQIFDFAYEIKARKNSKENKKRQCGYTYKNVLASYVHLYFASNKSFAATFVNNCLQAG